jgi:hypothetical protein
MNLSFILFDQNTSDNDPYVGSGSTLNVIPFIHDYTGMQQANLVLD